MIKNVSLFLTIFLIVFVLLILSLTLSFDSKTKLMPLGIGSMTLVLGLALLLGEMFPRFKRLFDVDLFKTKGVFERKTFQVKWSERKGFLIITFWLILFSFLIFLLGFLVAIPLCVFLFIKFFGNQSWSKSLIVTAIVWIFIYGVFQVLMGFKLFEGIIFGGIV